MHAAFFFLVFLAFAALFGISARRALARGYTHSRSGYRFDRSTSPELFWMMVGLEFFACAACLLGAVKLAFA